MEHTSTLGSADNLGSVLREQGMYEESEALNRQALVGREKVPGLGEHPDTWRSVNNLASVLEEQGKYEEAKVMVAQAEYTVVWSSTVFSGMR